MYLKICDISDNIIWPFLLNTLKENHKSLLQLVIKERKKIPKNSIKFLKISKATLPVFHCLPKLHKAGFPSRPIIGSPTWLTTNWSILLDSILEQIPVHYALKNSIDLIRSLENFELSDNHLLCSADVASLYTNIDLGRLFSVIEFKSSLPLASNILTFICY
jgi:hypothetical protein